MTPPPTVPQPRSAKLTDLLEERMSLDWGWQHSAPEAKPLPSPPCVRRTESRRWKKSSSPRNSDPEAGPGEVLVRVEAEGVCGRDFVDRRGGFRGIKLPVVLGHEFAGTVVEVGTRGRRFRAVGDRVANLLRLSCGKCPSCLRGDAPVCEAPWQSFGQTRDGGYAEYVTAPATALVKVPVRAPSSSRPHRRRAPWGSRSAPCARWDSFRPESRCSLPARAAGWGWPRFR